MVLVYRILSKFAFQLSNSFQEIWTFAKQIQFPKVISFLFTFDLTPYYLMTIRCDYQTFVIFIDLYTHKIVESYVF